MTTRSSDISRRFATVEEHAHPVVSNDVIYQGSALGDNASGYARPLVAGDPFLGFAAEHVDNTGGAAGAKYVTARVNCAIELPVTGVVITSLGATVYASDDDTFTLTASTNTPIGYVARYVANDKAIVRTMAYNAVLGGVIADEAITLGMMADLTRGSILTGQTSNNRPTALNAKTSGYILVGDGTDLASVAVSNDGRLAANGALTLAPLGQQSYPKKTITVDATAGAIVLTEAKVLGGIIERDPNGAHRTDVLPTAAAMVAALPGVRVGTVIPLEIRNTADAAENITMQAGAGGTDSGLMTIAENNTGLFEILFTNVTAAAEAYTLRKIGTMVSQA
jgi:hypothetical protein